MKQIVAVIIAASSLSAYASCTGYGSLRTCTDTNNGNTYTTQTIGDTSYTSGRNSNTGSTWRETATNVGNTTYYNGTAADGNTWSGTSTTVGNTTYSRGTDSRGNPYSGVNRR